MFCLSTYIFAPIRWVLSAAVFVLIQFFPTATRKFYETETRLTIGAVVRHHGFRLLTYRCQTADGYELALFRLVRRKRVGTGGLGPVLLLHGLLDCAFTFLACGSQHSLAYMLCDAGYDVWLGNTRGTRYSCRHVFLDTQAEEYYKFCVDDMAEHDVPTIVDTILSQNRGRFNKLDIVAHSQGTTICFAWFAQHPELAEAAVRSFVALGPIATVCDIQHSLLRWCGYLHLDKIIRLSYGDGPFLPPPTGFTSTFVGWACYHFQWIINLLLAWTVGRGTTTFSKVQAQFFGNHELGGSSTHNVNYWLQASRYRDYEMRMFDFGAVENVNLYLSAQPPRYPIERIPTCLPMLFFVGHKDLLIGKNDLRELVKRLKPTERPVFLIRELEHYSHICYLWAPDANVRIFEPVKQFLLHADVKIVRKR